MYIPYPQREMYVKELCCMVCAHMSAISVDPLRTPQDQIHPRDGGSYLGDDAGP